MLTTFMLELYIFSKIQSRCLLVLFLLSEKIDFHMSSVIIFICILRELALLIKGKHFTLVVLVVTCA